MDTGVENVAGEPVFFVLVGSALAADNQALTWAREGFTVRKVRGAKMRRYAGVFDEFGAALQFPAYFGENAAAFDECLSDLEWLPARRGYVVIIREAAAVLQDEGADGVAWLSALFMRIRAEWARPVVDGEPWDRPGLPFSVVLQFEDVESFYASRWAKSGVGFQQIEPL